MDAEKIAEINKKREENIVKREKLKKLR